MKPLSLDYEGPTIGVIKIASAITRPERLDPAE